MTRARVTATALVVAAGAVATTLGVTWASDSPSPHLERTSSAVLFDDVALAPGVPVVRCASLVPRGASLAGLGFDGRATGSLAPAIDVRIERGAGTEPAAAFRTDPDDCGDFVPVATAYAGPLVGMPTEATRTTTPVAIDADRPVLYRTTLTLTDPRAGSTAFGLRITGTFTEAPAPAPTPPPPPEHEGDNDQARARCVEPQSGDRIQRTARAGAVRLIVRTPQQLPLQIVRPLPVYVTTSANGRPRMVAGDRVVRLGRTVGGRWIGHVPVEALSRTQRVRVTSGRASVAVPIVTRPCTVRVRTFLRGGGTVDLRIDGRQPLAGLRVRLPAVVGRLAGGTLTVRDTDDRGHARSARGSVGAQGRPPTRRLPRVAVTGRAVELLDVPSGIRTLSLRLRASGSARARRVTCRRPYATVGRLTTVDPAGLRSHRVRSPLRLAGDRCPRR